MAVTKNYLTDVYVAGKINVNDAEHYLAQGGGGNPVWNADANDYYYLDRSANTFGWAIGNTDVFKVGSSGITVPSLTSGRVPYVSTGGAILDDAGLTYNASTDTLTAGVFSGSGASLTSLSASNLSTGTVATARLGSGSANSGVFLRGDQTWAAVSNSGQTMVAWGAAANEPPASNYAGLNTRNNHLVLEFDASTNQDAIFSGVLPRRYGGGGITVAIAWMGATATSGNVVWLAQVERCDTATDLDADSFATTQTATGAASGTSGRPTYTEIAFTNGSQMDSLAAGEAFRLKVTRNASSGSDTMTGLAQIKTVEIRET